MKKNQCMGIFALWFLALLIFAGPGFASQEVAIERAKAAVDIVHKNAGKVGWKEPLVGYVENGKSTAYEDHFLAGHTYMIILVGCEEASDVDLAVYDENEYEIEVDTKAGPVSTVLVTPKWDGKFYVKVTVSQANSGAHLVVLTAFTPPN